MTLKINIASIFILSFYIISCTHNNTKVNNKKQQIKWDKVDTVIVLNQLIDSFWSATNNNDSNIVIKKFKICYDSLDSFAGKKDYHTDTKIQYYSKFYTILQEVLKNTKINHLKKQNFRLLRLLVFYNQIWNNAQNIIYYFNQLQSNYLWEQLPTIDKIQRLHEVGIAYNQINDTEKASLVYKQTLALAKSIESNDDIARVTFNINKLNAANGLQDSIINLSNAIVEKNIEKKLKSSLYQSLANAYIEKNDYTKAIGYNTKGLNILLQLVNGNKIPEDINKRLANAYATRAQIYNAKNDIANATINFSNAEKEYLKYQNGTSRELGKFYIQTGKFKAKSPQSTLTYSPLTYYNKALQALQPNTTYTDSLALPDTTKLTAENVYFEALDAKANYLLPNALAQNNIVLLKKIIEYYQVSFTVEKLLLKNFVYETAKIDFINESKKRTANALQICYKLFSITKQQDWINAAFQFIENNKATVLLDRLKKNNVINQVLKKDNRIKELDKLNNKISDFKVENNTKNNQDLDNAQSEKEKIEFELQQDYPQLKNLQVFANNVSISNAQNFLNKNTAIIDYLFFDSTLYSVSIYQKQAFIKQEHLNENEIITFKNNCSNLDMQQNNPIAFLNYSNKICNKIFPQNINPNIKEIIIIPDGELNNICFEALCPMVSNNYSSNSFLISKYVFSYCYSFASILEKNEYNETKNKILICTPASQQQINGQSVLFNSYNEGNEIKEIFNKANWLNNKEATKFNFLHQYNQYNILHIASHSTADTINGNSYISFYDSVINANSFYANTIKPNLVFLSACHTSQGKLTNSEGVLSLARSVYYAGAQNVVASQWSVNDASTSQLVQQFYKKINTVKYASALQLAKLHYIQTVSAEKKIPFYWAPFIHIGYQKTYKTNNNQIFYICCGASLLLFALVYLYKKKRIA